MVYEGTLANGKNFVGFVYLFIYNLIFVFFKKNKRAVDILSRSRIYV